MISVTHWNLMQMLQEKYVPSKYYCMYYQPQEKNVFAKILILDQFT